MLEINVTVRPNLDGWWAEVAELPGCFSFGKSLEHLKEKLRESIGLHIEGMKDDGEEIPVELLNGNYSLVLHINIKDLFEHFPLTISGVAWKAGMNRTLLNQYIKGEKTMSENQAVRITGTIRSIGQELSSLRV
jgi:predicted RNase H-like HicB family nuclease